VQADGRVTRARGKAHAGRHARRVARGGREARCAQVECAGPSSGGATEAHCGVQSVGRVCWRARDGNGVRARTQGGGARSRSPTCLCSTPLKWRFHRHPPDPPHAKRSHTQRLNEAVCPHHAAAPPLTAGVWQWTPTRPLLPGGNIFARPWPNTEPWCDPGSVGRSTKGSRRSSARSSVQPSARERGLPRRPPPPRS
jgi:hypothetical protein